MPGTVIVQPSGIGYADETSVDRDEHGVLWRRVGSCPGRGRPQFGKVHPLRQRRAMRRLLCGVCGGPADRTELGVLWLIRDYTDDWPGWPEGMAATEPPVCLPCAKIAVRACPALRSGHIAVRVAGSTVAGVYGIRYQAGHGGEDAIVTFDDPAIRWTRAAQLVRELRGCTVVSP
jgi:hypothetical protein